MSIASFIEQYGYLAVAIGSFLEGETVLVLAGFAAHRGLMNLGDVMLIAFAASTAGDQFYFHLGRLYGDRLMARFPGLRARALRFEPLLGRYHTPLILGIRFMVGLRTAGPILMGWAGIRPLRFAVLNMIGAAIWAFIIAGAGYLFGQVLERLIADVKAMEEFVLLGILVAGSGLWLARHLKRRRVDHLTRP